jgi:sugar (pentulose or hexulose) kinase
MIAEPVPSTEVGMVRMVLDSLALAYRRTVRTASRVAGVSPEVVHVVGGGSQSGLLCQLTDDALRTVDCLGRLGRSRGPVGVSRCA